MDNTGYISDHPPHYNGSVDKKLSSKTPGPTVTRPYYGENRVGMVEAMEELRQRIGPNAFSAPLDQGELTTTDKYSLGFLIFFPCFFFTLGIILTSVL